MKIQLYTHLRSITQKKNTKKEIKKVTMKKKLFTLKDITDLWSK
jgi:hypothetical protein